MNRRRFCAKTTTSLVALAAVATVPRAARASGESGSFIDVPTYRQQRNLSCEYAALTIAIAAFGSWVSEYEFDQRVGWSDNPHWGFRGDINGQWGNTTDYGVYPEALVAPLADFGFLGEPLYGAGDASVLTNHLDAGLPMLVWLGLWGDLSFYEYAEDGTPFKLTPGYHVVVAYGYDDSAVYTSDPAREDYVSYDWDSFMSMWAVLDGMALGVSPL